MVKMLQNENENENEKKIIIFPIMFALVKSNCYYRL